MNTQTVKSENYNLSVLNKLIGMKIISIDKGILVGTLEDLLIDPNMLEIAAIITQKGDPLRNDFRAIPSDSVCVWGQDVILVEKTNVLCTKNELPDLANWLSFIDNIHDETIITTSSKRIGKVEDIVISTDGRITAYTFHPSDSQSRNANSYADHDVFSIPVLATHALGTEALMVNENDFS
jgi:sporulation protein YlmC with PRC-barrel domain